MARPAKQVDCNEGAKTRLLEIARSRKERSGLSLRAKIVLQCVEGKSIKEITTIYGVSNETVIRWRDRFILLQELPSAEEYHVILDNHAIHKRHEVWLPGTLAMPYPQLEHENVFFHYTHTYSM